MHSSKPLIVVERIDRSPGRISVYLRLRVNPPSSVCVTTLPADERPGRCTVAGDARPCTARVTWATVRP
jgi:hypothetical protein